MITKECPQCGESIAQAAMRHKCGWTAHVNDKVIDHDWWRCAHEDRGQRCAEPGVVSPSTHGGLFFCWTHVPAMPQMKDGVRMPPPQGFFAGWRKKLGPRSVDFEGELERRALQDEL